MSSVAEAEGRYVGIVESWTSSAWEQKAGEPRTRSHGPYKTSPNDLLLWTKIDFTRNQIQTELPFSGSQNSDLTTEGPDPIVIMNELTT